MARQTHEIAVATDAAVEVVRERVEAMREADEAARLRRPYSSPLRLKYQIGSTAVSTISPSASG